MLNPRVYVRRGPNGEVSTLSYLCPSMYATMHGCTCICADRIRASNFKTQGFCPPMASCVRLDLVHGFSLSRKIRERMTRERMTQIGSLRRKAFPGGVIEERLVYFLEGFLAAAVGILDRRLASRERKRVSTNLRQLASPSQII